VRGGRSFGLSRAAHVTLGPRGRGGVVVGSTFSFQSMYMHTVGDRAEAVNQMALDATRLYTTIGTAIGVLPDEGGAARLAAREAAGQPTAWYQWWVHSAAPTFAEWNKFHIAQTGGEGRGGIIGDYLSWTNRFETDWSEYTAWAKRLDAVLQGAVLLGIMPKDTPATQPLQTTAIEDAANLVHHAGEDVYHAGKKALTLAEVATYGALGLGGVLVVTSIVQAVRAGDDPVGRYVRYARGR
jgi:hypothetical protein